MDSEQNKFKMIVAVSINGECLRTPLGILFQNDRDVVIKAVRNTPRALGWASTILKNDVSFVMQCMREANSAEVLEYASDDLQRLFRNDRDVVIAAVRNTSRALGWASNNLKNDVLFVLQCMRETNSAEVLEYASDDLQRLFRNDRDVVIAAVRNTPSTLGWASTDLKKDVSFVMQCMCEANSAEILEYASDDLQNGGFQHFLINEFVSHHNFHASGFLLAVGCSKLLPRTAKLAPIPSCHLGILSHGVETTTAITMLVADFVGVPYGEDLRLCNTSFDLLETHDAAELDDDIGYDSGEASD